MKFVLIVLLMTLSGCAGALSSATPQPTTYVLNPLPPQHIDEGMTQTIEIRDIKLPPGLDTQDIVVSVENRRKLDTYADAQWADDLDVLIKDIVIKNTQTAFPNALVQAGVKPDVVLYIDVQTFQASYQGDGTQENPMLEVALQMTMQRAEQESVQRLRITKTEVTSQNTITEVVGGLEQLLSAAIYDVLAIVDNAL